MKECLTVLNMLKGNKLKNIKNLKEKSKGRKKAYETQYDLSELEAVHILELEDL
jgi:hypothetical protein